MRKKIYRLSEGQFDTRQINIVSSVDSIDITCNVTRELEGSFEISGENDMPIRGVIYSTNPYIITKDYQFDGVHNTIKYSLKHTNFKKNDVIEGRFIVISNGASLEIPIKITFTKNTIKSSVGEINSLKDFKFDNLKFLFLADIVLEKTDIIGSFNFKHLKLHL